MTRALLATLLLCTAAMATEELRPLRTDRPFVTLSPYTVDARHVQLEVDVVAYLRDNERGDPFERIVVGGFNVRVGITDTVEASLLFDAYVREDNGLTTSDGFGDTVLRVKINLIGNDEGDFGFGVVPYLRFPTSSGGVGRGHDKIEGGVLIPIEVQVDEHWNTAFQLGLGITRDADDTEYNVDILVSIRVTRTITAPLDVFVELASLWPGNAGSDSGMVVAAGSSFVATASVGALYAVGDDMQVDIVVFFGATTAAPDVYVTLGFTKRW